MAEVHAIDVSQDTCIRGSGKPHEPTGYLRKSRFNKVWYAHRLAYSDANGGIPEGYHIPAGHREVHSLPKAANYYANLTTCKYEHSFDSHNEKQRICLTCKHKAANAYTSRKRMEKIL